MSEETTDQAIVEEPQGTDTTDWKAEARKWEKYAKENKAAKDELDALKAAQMTEQEKLVKRAEEAEAALASANAQIQHSKDVQEVATASGVPSSLLELMPDREAMDAFVERYQAERPETPTIHSAPQAPKSRLSNESTAKVSNADVFAQMLQDF